MGNQADAKPGVAELMGRALIAGGAVLALLAIFEIHPIDRGLWPYALAPGVFLLGIALALVGRRAGRTE